METWLTVLIIAIILMAVALAWLQRMGRGVKDSKTGAPGRHKAGRSGAGPVNYLLAPRHPDAMAGALFELLSRKLSFKEITAFVELVISPEMTTRYLERLSAKTSLAKFAEGLAFLCNSMEVNGFTPEQRARVAEALRHKTRKEYKLLEVQKNLDDLF